MVEVGIAIAARLPDELTITPWDEAHRPLRFDVLTIGFGEEGLDVISRLGIIRLELHVVLISVELCDIDGLAIRCPRDVCQILFFRFACLDVDSLTRSEIVDTEGDVVTRHPCHRIVELLFGSLTYVGVDEWIRGDH